MSVCVCVCVCTYCGRFGVECLFLAECYDVIVADNVQSRFLRDIMLYELLSLLL